MKIIKRSSKSSQSFKVIRNNFVWGGSSPDIDQELTFIGADQMSEALGLVQRGCIIPTDMPPLSDYICLRSFELPGSKQKYSAKPNEVVELRSEDALRLMLQGVVIPRDQSRWSPFRIKKQKQLSEREKFLKEYSQKWTKEG
jgi:hypothetical protein